MSEENSYTTYNFEAVNNQIREIARRERARSFAYWLQSLKTLLIYIAIVSLIVAFLVLIFSWAFRIINAPYVEKKTEIVRPEIVEKEVLKVVQVPVEKSILEASDKSYKGPVNQPVARENNNRISPEKIVTNYHTFQSVPVSRFANYGFSEVVTGWKYKDSNSKFPEVQFCYIMLRKPNNSSALRADLAQIDNEGSYDAFINRKLALEVGVPQSVLNDVLGYCRWASAS